ncbi:MAG: hypothetical protein ACI4WR_08695 [Bulleidia sp.]
MKNRFRMMTAALLAAAVLTGCSASRNTQNTNTPATASETAQDAQTTGAYEINADLTSANLPDDAQKAFDKALDGMTGTAYSPIVLLARQVVSGTNYSILCMEQTTVPGAPPELHIITIYEDLDGNASISEDTLFDLSAAGVSSAASIDPESVGAYETNTEFTPEEIPEAASSALEKALDGLTGADYQAAALLGTQTVSGTNYAVLCLVTPVVPDGEACSTWSVVTVYQSLDGTCEITSVYDIEPAA